MGRFKTQQTTADHDAAFAAAGHPAERLDVAAFVAADDAEFGRLAGAIGRPELMRFATRHAMSRPALMRFALKLLGNLTDPRGDASDRLINALTRLAPAR